MYRLPLDKFESKLEWLTIVEGTHNLWSDISEPYKETIRAFLIHFNTEVLRQVSKKQFTFSNGSVGNFFLTGARIFFNSLETALFWFSRVVRIPSNSSVLPIINTNSTIHIGVELENGMIIHGQHEISHPTAIPSLPSPRYTPSYLPPSPGLHRPEASPQLSFTQFSAIPCPRPQLYSYPQHLFPPPLYSQSNSPRPASPNSPQSSPPLSTSPISNASLQTNVVHTPFLPQIAQQFTPQLAVSQQTPPPPSPIPVQPPTPSKLRTSNRNLVVNKSGGRPLDAKVKRLFYLNEDRQEILPPCNHAVLTKIREQDIIVYSIGSLWTSIIPCLVLTGIGEEISRKAGPKLLILNGYPDRETHDVSAVEYVAAITNALNRWGTLSHTPREYITHVLWVEGSKVVVDEAALRELGIVCIRVARAAGCEEDAPSYAETDLVQKLKTLGGE